MNANGEYGFMQFKSELAIGFVIYHPTDEFYKRLELIRAEGFKIYVFDNSPDETKLSELVNKIPEISYITAGKNLGLGVGLSGINATAYYEGYKSLVFFDQDTGLTSDTLSFIHGLVVGKKQHVLNDYAVITFSSNERESEELYDIQDASLVISSGSLFSLPLLKKMDWHNENYFVDGVDYEVCLRARKKGFKVGVCYNTPGFDHVNEQPDKIVKIFNKSLLIRRYSITRILDSLGAYFKLIIAALFSLDFKFTFILARSFLIYLLGQTLSRRLIKKDD